MHKNGFESYRSVRKEWKINSVTRVKGSKKAYSRKNYKIQEEEN